MRNLKLAAGWITILLASMLASCGAPVSAGPAESPATAVSRTLEAAPLGTSASLALPASPSPSLPASPASPDSTATTTAPPGPPATPTLDVRLDPKTWRTWPVVPALSAAARQIYSRGIELGNDPQRFSTVGDCQSQPNVFLGIYATNRYFLGEGYQALQETIDSYHDSFGRQSLSVRDGLSAPSALTSLWSDRKACGATENPVECELRTYHPAIVFVNLGTNWKAGASAEAYGGYLRRIVELLIARGSLPILSTKADNVEGDFSLNQEIAQVAHDYDLPLWNLWRAVQDLPNHGLDPERKDIYLTPEAWDRRNFTALQTLDAIRRELK